MTAVLVRGTPDNTWTEEQILSLLEESAASDLLEDRDYHKVLLALDELRSRDSILDGQRTSDVLFRAARQHGTKGPLGDKIAELVSRLANRDEGVFQRLQVEIEDLGQTPPGLRSVCSMVGRLTIDRKRGAVKSLLRVLPAFTKTRDLSDAIADAIIKAGRNEQIGSEVASSLIPELENYTDPQRFLYSLRIASQIGDKIILPTMLTVLKHLKEGWFADNLTELENGVCDYFIRFPVEEAVLDLAELLKRRKRHDRFNVLKVFQYPLTATLLLDFIEQSLATGGDYDLRVQCMIVLPELDPTLIDVDRLLSFRQLQEWPSSDLRFCAKRILVKLGSSAKSRLFSLYSNAKLADFATECLGEIGITLDEISDHVPESSMSQMARFFDEGLAPEHLWDDEEHLGDQVKGFKITKFEHMLFDIFTRLNFIARFTEPSKKPGVDIVALQTAGTHIVIAGATTGVVKDDLQQLNETLVDLKKSLPNLTSRNLLLPALFTLQDSFVPSDIDYARKNGIALLRANDVKEILLMAKTSRKSQHMIQYLLTKIPSSVLP